MGSAFDVDALAVKAEKVAKLNPRSVTGGQSAQAAASAAEENCAAALAVVDELAAADDYVRATQVLGLLQPLAAAGDPKLRAQVQKQMKDLTAARAAHDQVARQIEKLAASLTVQAA